eukprot:Plantae.Rhodophyta-Hildenbrandia_rubra.ctg10205.p2 GENE.Plantae.Rhodophyta-Hildenbrandia_rubra.ctg10205~~Plantae.Rhodophyta-Hildenbrandia_rubra.ctg10205.p2  ORF type:complete len:334 (-),score=88.80 Plantae.Rhodophyta-Hildenbrandia_rubra.ctg10205:494-1495(-)
MDDDSAIMLRQQSAHDEELADRAAILQQELEIAREEASETAEELQKVKEELKSAHVGQEELDSLRNVQEEARMLRRDVAENGERLKELFSLRKKFAALEGDVIYYREQEGILKKQGKALTIERDRLLQQLKEARAKIANSNKPQVSQEQEKSSDEVEILQQECRNLEDSLFELKVLSKSQQTDYEHETKALKDEIQLLRAELEAKNEALKGAEKALKLEKETSNAKDMDEERSAILRESRKWMKENSEVRESLYDLIKQMSVQRNQFKAINKASRESQKELRLKEARLEKLQASFETLLKDLDTAQTKYKILEFESTQRLKEKDQMILLLTSK